MAEPTTLKPSTAKPLAGGAVSRRVKLIDRAADLVIRASGMGIVVMVTLIFVFIGLEALPLFRGARQHERFTTTLPGQTKSGNLLALGIDEYESHLYYLDAAKGTVRFVEMLAQKNDAEFPLTGLKGSHATAAYRTPSRDKLVVGTDDGSLLIAEAKFGITYGAGAERTVKPGFKELARIEVVPGGGVISLVHARQNSEGAYFYAVATADGRIFTGKFVEDEPAGEPQAVGGKFEGRVTALIIDHEGNRLFVATDQAKLYHYDLETDREAPFRVYAMPASITALDYMIGDVALVIGFADGTVESWFGVREKPTDVQKPLHRIHTFERMPGAVTFIQPSARDKGFAVGSVDGTVKLNFTTSERTLLTAKMAAGIGRIAYSPKLTGLLTLADDATLRFAEIDNPHPEISAKVLFGKVHYEGYDTADYIWQSTGGTDDFEGKFSLMPLAVGTIKGAFYGLLFAIPVAVLAALYTSQFMSPRLRGYVKPSVEIMAALPSVVIGFLAGLWLAPHLETVMVGTLVAVFVVPFTVAAGSSVWTLLPRKVRHRVPHGMELMLVIPLVAGGFWLSQQFGPVLEAAFFHGNYKQWAFDLFGQQFEQRNSIVIGISMGFAVIPIIFTISEDAFSNVPPSFKSASYALGASRWQTAWRVIMPTASPGVFSAVMIGFGRAVGETMIVLMATGNTPIMSLSPFNGMRTLSANIAVEIPEAPVAGTLYRVLFVAALLLFALTFVVNTVAEIVRQRLRQKYQAV